MSDHESDESDLKTLSIDGWRAGIRFNSCHLIPHHEKCSRLHGHTYVLHLKIKGHPDESGFLMDFSEIKRALKAIADSLDHRILLAGNNPHITITQKGGEVEAIYSGKRYVFPEGDVVILDLPSMTAEMMSEYIAKEFVKHAAIPDNIVKIKAGLDEGPGQGAWSTLVLR
jgi:6-pyruvoyltetrahydropterin/6-carboxytetrahydropterin synthase